MSDIPASHPSASFPGLTGLFFKFLRFGCLAFGGPVAQIAMLRQTLVEEEHWVSSARFNRLLAVMQILPGPEAHELCVHMGMVARGRLGGLLAGLGFMLPGFVLMLLAAWLYKDWVVGHPIAATVFFGIQIVVLAVIARAVHRIGEHILEDRLLIGLAIVSLIATLIGVPFWLPLLASGLIYGFRDRRGIAIGIAIGAILLGLALHYGWSRHSGGAIANLTEPSLWALFIAGLKGGLLTFGGAYTAIPYVRSDTVGRGWLSDGAFLDGVAFAGILPTPLVIFATFTGYLVGGFAGALVITFGMFLPAFAFSMVLFEQLESVVENPQLHHFLNGIAAAVTGVIAATLLQLGWATFGRAQFWSVAAILFVLALVAVYKLKGKWVAPALILGGGVAGALLPL